MKKVFTFLFVVAAFGGLFAQDTPTAEEIAAAYIENTGGAEAWKAVKTMRMNGTAAMQGMEFPITMSSAEGNKMRVDVNVQGQKIIQATNGETAWQVMPFMGINEPTAMSDDEAADMNDQEFLSEFIDSEERGYTLEVVEGKEIEGSKTIGVRVTNEKKDVDRTYFFDPEFMVPIAMSTKGKGGQMKGIEMMTMMSDYGEVDGLVMPMFMDNQINGQSFQKITIKEVELNPELEEGLFELPKN